MCSMRRWAERSDCLAHGNKLDHHARRHFVLDLLNTGISSRRVQAHAGQGGHQLNARESTAPRLGFALIQQHRADALAGVSGIDEERADLGRIGARVEQRRVPFRALVAAKQGSTVTPTSAADDDRAFLDDKKSSVLDELRINAESTLQRALDLFRPVVTFAQLPGRAVYQIPQDLAIL